MLNAVGIAVAVLCPAVEIVHKPFPVRHSVKGLSELISYARSLDDEIR